MTVYYANGILWLWGDKMVKQLTQNDLINISNNFILTKHAFYRVKNRLKYTMSDIKKSIVNSMLGYYNTDGSINVQVGDREEYYVFTFEDNKYRMITCKEPSLNGYKLSDKYKLALLGIKR